MDWVWALPELNLILVRGRMEDLLPIDNFNKLDWFQSKLRKVATIMISKENRGDSVEISPDLARSLYKSKLARSGGKLTRSGDILLDLVRSRRK